MSDVSSVKTKKYSELVKSLPRKRLSCQFLQDGMLFKPEGIAHCGYYSPRPDGTTDSPYDHPFYVFSKEGLYEREPLVKDIISIAVESKNELVYKLNIGESCICSDCKCLTNGEFDNIDVDNFKLRALSFFDSYVCNSSCLYCPQDHTEKPLYDIVSLVKSFIEEGIIEADKPNSINSILYAGGEPSINPKIELLGKLLNDSAKSIFIPTSGIKYSDAIAEMLTNYSNVSMNVSLDSGTKETYKKIKNVDQFDNVVENFVKYTKVAKDSSQQTQLKYIILEQNCSKSEIDSFFNVIVENELTNIQVVLDEDVYAGLPSEDLINGAVYFILKSKEVLGRYPMLFPTIQVRIFEKYNIVDIEELQKLKASCGM